MKSAPWYIRDKEGTAPDIKVPSFTPQTAISGWYDRSKKGYQAKTFRKGAC